MVQFNNKTLYVLITEQCNLSCPHCDVYKHTNDNYNEEKFINVLKEFDGKFILFGGEPLLYPERIENIFDNNLGNKIKGISSNLILLNNKTFNILKKIGGVTTSWNPNRFNNDQYQLWLNNIDICLNNNIRLGILITLTEDLFEYGSDNLSKLISTWNNGINSIKFEHVVDKNNDINYYQKADEFMCEMLDKVSKKNISNNERYYYKNCDDTYTLYPNGKVKYGCPHNMNRIILKECFGCKYNVKCRPCTLQLMCSRPHKFISKLNEVQY